MDVHRECHRECHLPVRRSGAIPASATARASSSWRRNFPARASAGSTSRTTPTEVGELEVENFPTILVERDGAELFYGPLLPHHGHLGRLLMKSSLGRKILAMVSWIASAAARGSAACADRPPDHDVVGAGGKSLRHVDGALLVADVGTGGPDAGRDDEQSLAEFGFQLRRLVTRSDDAVAARLHGAASRGRGPAARASSWRPFRRDRSGRSW